MQNANHTFKIATLRSPRDGKPLVETFSVESFAKKVSIPKKSAALYEAYHFQKSELKRLTAEAGQARLNGDLERSKQLKVEAKQFKEALDNTKFGAAVLPFIWKNDQTFKLNDKGIAQRDNEPITHFSLIMLDIESKTTKEEIHAVLSGLEYILWTTITHTEQDPRFRVVLFPEKPLTKHEALSVIYRIDARLPARNDLSKKTQCVDPASLEAGRLMFLPMWLTNHPLQFDFVHNHGALLTTRSFPLTEEVEALIAKRAAAAQAHSNAERDSNVSKLRTSPASSTTSAGLVVRYRDKDWLNPDAEFETDDGYITLKDVDRKVSGVRCPFHMDNVGSEFIAPNKYTKRPQLICAKCGTFKMLPPTAFEPEEEEVESFLPKIGSGKKRQPVGVAQAQAVEAKKPAPVLEYRPSTPEDILTAAEKAAQDPTSPLVTLNSRYLPEGLAGVLPEEGIVTIRSPKGTGKTELLKTVVEQCERDGHTRLLLGHRIHLLRNLSTRLDLTNYQDIEDRSTADDMALCINSLRRIVPGKTDPYHTVIIDESEQVLSGLLAKTLQSDISTVFNSLVWVIKKAKRVIVLDADLTGALTIDVIHELRGKDKEEKAVLGIDNEYKVGAGQVTRMYEDKDHLLGDALADLAAGEKVFIATNNAALCQTLGNIARADGKNVLVVTADTQVLEEVAAFTESPTTEQVKYDAVFASPTVSTGVSIDGKHFTRVYGWFSVTPGTFQDADQAISRVRNCSDIRIWVQPSKTDSILQSEQSIYEQIIAVEKGTLKRLVDEPELTQGQLMWARIYATIKAHNASSSRFKDVQFKALREHHGFAVEHVEKNVELSDMTKAMLKLFKHTGKDRGEAVFNARHIGDDEAYELGRKRNLTEDEYLSLERYRIKSALMPEASTVDFEELDPTLEDFQRAVKEELLRSLSRVRTLVRTDLSSLASWDAASRAKNKDTFTAATHHIQRKSLTDAMLVAAGISPETVYKQTVAGEKYEVSPGQLKAAAEVFEKHKKDFNFYFNARIKDPTSDQNLVKVWNATLGDVLKLPVVKKRVRTKEFDGMKYFVDSSKVELTHLVLASAKPH